MSEDFIQIRNELRYLTGPAQWLRDARVLESLDSTNDYAKTLIRSGTENIPMLVIANTQTAGRGRFQRQWHSPPDTGLWFSLIQCVNPDQYWSGTSLVTGIITAKAIRDSTGIEAKLKWPNDLLVNGKKCAGILIETVIDEATMYIITGVGINLNQEQFPEGLADIATSLYLESGQKFNRLSVLKHWIRFAENYDRIKPESVVEEWKSMTDMLGKKIIVEEMQRVFEAVALDITEEGGLIVKTDTAIRTIYAADIRIHSIKN